MRYFGAGITAQDRRERTSGAPGGASVGYPPVGHRLNHKIRAPLMGTSTPKIRPTTVRRSPMIAICLDRTRVRRCSLVMICLRPPQLSRSLRNHCSRFGTRIRRLNFDTVRREGDDQIGKPVLGRLVKYGLNLHFGSHHISQTATRPPGTTASPNYFIRSCYFTPKYCGLVPSEAQPGSVGRCGLVIIRAIGDQQQLAVGHVLKAPVHGDIQALMRPTPPTVEQRARRRPGGDSPRPMAPDTCAAGNAFLSAAMCISAYQKSSDC